MARSLPLAQRERLQRTIGRLHEVFAPYDHVAPVAGCPHCASLRNVTRLQGASLRDLSAEDLDDLAWRAITTWGTEADLKHFLPRLLELAAWDQLKCEVEIVFGKLSLCDRQCWPAVEQAALNGYLDAVWAASLVEEPDATTNVERWLCALARATPLSDFPLLLDQWQEQLDGPAALHLSRFVAQSYPGLMESRRLPNAFWPEGHELQVRRWLGSEPLRAALEAAFFRQPDDSRGAALSDALALLDNYGMAARNATGSTSLG